ncbi:unnamed protein product [Heterobilharzia americana]|nr:unnamed protein product [Heterobilharzia americana]CAH8440377.1 unnamed protein product [Heterobilharzia americana]
MDSGQALILLRAYLHLSGLRGKYSSETTVGKGRPQNYCGHFQRDTGQNNITHLETTGQYLRKTALRTIVGVQEVVMKGQRISITFSETVDVHESISASSKHNKEKEQLKSRLRKSLRNDHEQWWVAKDKQMEKGRQSFHVNRQTIEKVDS